MKNNMAQQKLISLTVSLLLVVVVILSQHSLSMSLVLISPFFFDIGHLFLAMLYQQKKQLINQFFWIKLSTSIMFLLVLFFFGNNAFNYWLIYSIFFLHGMLGERFTIKAQTNSFHFVELLLPVTIYSYLLFIKTFEVEKSSSIVLAFVFFLVFNFFYLLHKKRNHWLGFYFFFFSLACFLALMFSSFLSFLVIVITPLYFHYISWYVFYFFKTEHKQVFIKQALKVNSAVWFFFALIILGGNLFGLSEIIAKSFIIPAWSVIHIFTTIKQEELPFKVELLLR